MISMLMVVTGQAPTVFRPPFGAMNDAISSTADTPVILWTVDTLDWKARDPKAIIDSVIHDVADGSIILMHDIHNPLSVTRQN